MRKSGTNEKWISFLRQKLGNYQKIVSKPGKLLQPRFERIRLGKELSGLYRLAVEP